MASIDSVSYVPHLFFCVTFLCHVCCHNVKADDLVDESGRSIDVAFDVRPDAIPSTRPLLGLTGERYVLTLRCRPPHVQIFAGSKGKLLTDLSVGHMWVVWSHVDNGQLLNRTAYGFGPSAEGKALIACAVQCDGDLKQEWMDYCRIQRTTTTALYFIVSAEQYSATLKMVTKHVSDFTGATRYGIINYSDKAMTCRGFVREVLASIGIAAPTPGLSMTTEYLSNIDKQIRRDIVQQQLKIGILVRPIPNAIVK